MGQYKYMITFIRGFKIGFDYDPKWQINIYLGLINLYIGLGDNAMGYNIFNKWPR